MPRQVNTKEKILECAFGLYAKPRMSEISLSEIAALAGISKTAIFRHYKNKEDLMEKMRERFFDAFAQMVCELDDGKKPYNLKSVSKAIKCVFDFSERFPNYLPYFLQTSFSDEVLTEGVNLILLDNGINIVQEDIFSEKKNFIPQNMVPSFFEQTLLMFLTQVGCQQNDYVQISDLKEYRTCLANLIYSGLGKKKNPLPLERKKELDELCKVQLESDEKSNRFLNAFLELIQNNKSSKITVEKIAAALGMAKSSIYSFFANKNDYLMNMLFQETERVGVILKEKCAAANNPDEALYILMKAQANYFALRPQVIMLHGYFIFQEAALAQEDLDAYHKRSIEFFEGSSLKNLLPATFNFPVNDNAVLFMKWVSGLTVGFMLMGTKYKFPPEWMDFYISIVYEFIQCGIKCAKKTNGEIE